MCISPRFVFGLLAFLAAGQAARAQIDHRVNQGNASSGGYLLDRNAQVGSGGYNLTRPGLDPGAGANAIITGNVTGLAGFKGYSPIPQANAFRGDLPSAGLSGFQSRGVGLPEVAPNRVSTPTYFFDPSRTIADVGQIRAGMNQPGTSRLLSPNLPPQELGITQTPRAQPNVRDPADQRLEVDTPSSDLGVRQTQTLKGARPLSADGVAPQYTRAAGSPIFGAALPGQGDDSDTVVRDARVDNVRVGPTLAELNAPESTKNLPPGPAGERQAGSPDRAASRLDAMNEPDKPMNEPRAPASVPPGRVAAPQTGALQPGIGQSAIQTTPPVVQDRFRTPPEPLPMDGLAPSNLGGDRFADFYNAFRIADQAGVNQLGFESQRLQPADPMRPGHVLARRTDAGLNQIDTSAKWAKDVFEDPVTTFVGKYANDLNRYLAAGEEAMKRGEYYKAARLFDLARAVDPVNPLPLLNRGLALVAAGDYVTATTALEDGLRRFPHIAAFKLDLLAMVGNKDVFDVRRADLENRLAVREQYDLRFLLGYLEFYTGLPEDGLRNLRRAANEAPAGSPIAAFAGLVTGETSLPSLPR